MDKIGIKESKDMIIAACDAIAENKEYLTDVDSAIGDGDHGVGMVLGMNAAKRELLAKDDFKNINEVFKIVGMEMVNTMGGASGVIFGTMFLGCATKGADYTEITCVELPKMFRNSLDKIKSRGGASVGDKTMIDAFEPAVIAMETSDSKDVLKLLYLATEAAKYGLEKTKDYKAKFGRAQYLGERAIGHQDAGATSVYIIFEAMYTYLKNIGE